MAAQRLCSVPDCGKKHLSRGFCKNHYWAFNKYGDPLFRKIARRGEPLAFLKSLIGTNSVECIKWPYAVVGTGYGSIRYEGRAHLTSRIMCRLAHGEPPFDNAEAAHSCGKGTEGCVNPNHLRWATPAENTADKDKHGTIARGEKSYGAKLTEEQVLAIRRRLAAGEVAQRIAEEYGQRSSNITRIKKRQRWAHI